MTNIFQGIAHLVQGLFNSVFTLIRGVIELVISLPRSVLLFAWRMIVRSTDFKGGLISYLKSNILLLTVLGLAFYIYRNNQVRAQVGRGGSKKIR